MIPVMTNEHRLTCAARNLPVLLPAIVFIRFYCPIDPECQYQAFSTTVLFAGLETVWVNQSDVLLRRVDDGTYNIRSPFLSQANTFVLQSYTPFCLRSEPSFIIHP